MSVGMSILTIGIDLPVEHLKGFPESAATAAMLCKATRDRGTISNEVTQSRIQQASQPAAVAKLRREILAMFE